MFTKKSNIDIKKSTLKIQDSKKDSASRLRHLKTILEHVDIEEAKSLFETNYSHVYYILYDTFVQAEATLKQRGHKAHREELDSSLWLLGKILCYLPELIARRWQCHSIGRIMGTLLHHGNNTKLRKEGVRYFLLWYQALGENAPNQVHIMYTELVPGMFVPQKCQIGISDSVEFNTLDLMNHPNMKGEMGASVFHDTSVHQVKAPEIVPLLLPASNERSAAPDPKDGLEIILECMVQATGCLKWRDNTPQKHMKCFAFLLQRFKDIYLPMICVNFDYGTSLYEPKLDLPVMRTVHKRDELMSSCIVVLIHWIARYTRDKLLTTRFDQLQIDDSVDHLMGGNMNNINSISGSISSSGGSAACEHLSLLTNLKYMGYSQQHLVRDVLFSTRENINFVIEMYRQAFLLNYSTKSEISAIRVAVSAYKDWMSNTPQPPFILEPETMLDGSVMDVTQQQQHQSTMSRQQQHQQQQQQRLRTDSYLGAITKENLIVRAGLQNVIQIFVTHAANAFMIQTSPITALSPLKAPEITELDEQTDVCKSILNIYRSMVMNPHMDARTWEQLLLVLLQITAVIVSQAPPNAKRSSLGGRLAQPVFQTLIVSWIRAHTLVPINITLWERFLNVLSSLTYREELIVEWYKTMLTLTRVMARQVYDLNLYDLPLDRVSEKKNKLRRGATTTHNNSSNSNSNNNHNNNNNHHSNNNNNSNNNESHNSGNISNSSVDMLKNTNSSNNRNSTSNIQNNKINLKSYDANNDESQFSLNKELINSVPGTPSLNRSYSEGSLAPSVHNNGRHNNNRHRHNHNHHHHHHHNHNHHQNGNHQHPRRSRPRKRLKSASSKVLPTLPTNVEYSINRILSNQTPMASINISISNETLKFNNVDMVLGNGDDNTLYQRNDQNDQSGIRRALSLDSVRPSARRRPPNKCDDESESQRESRTPSPTASSGIDGGSIKDSPMQIDVIAGDTSSIDTQDEFSTTSADRRCVILGGLARGWQPDVTAIIWKWMLGSLGDINKILNPKLHAQVYRHLIEVTDCLIKIKQNQGISEDNQSTPAQPLLQPPINYITPWCYAAFQLDSQYRDGKLYALQLLCTIARYGPTMSNEQLPLFYNALHQALTGEDRAMAYTVLRYLGGSRFLSLLLPGHSLLILDLVHAATNIFQSFDITAVPRAEAAALLGSLLCFPKSSMPTPSIKPSEPNVVLMDCPEIQDHVLNVILRCARREPTSKARCIAIVSLGQWILKNLIKSSSSPSKVQRNFSQKINSKTTPISSPSSSTVPNAPFNPRIKEAIQVLLQALQFKHRTIARVAAETLKLCAERGKFIAQIERLPQLIINAICIALEIQNISNPKDSDKFVLMALLLCLGEFCMAIPIQLLMRPMNNNNNNSGQNDSGGGGDSLIMIVLKILHQIATGSHTDRIKLFTADEDFDMSIAVDDVRVHKSDANYQTAETTQNCIAAIRLCAKTVALHLVTNLGHFPMGIGASRLSSMVDEHDDMTLPSAHLSNSTDFNNISSGTTMRNSNIDSIEFNGNTNQLNVINSKHLQMFLLNSGLIASFIELPALKLPGGGITAGLLTAERQVRVLLRDLNGKACWDASILYREPKLQITNIDLKSNNNYQQQSAHSSYHDQQRTPFQMSSMNNNSTLAAPPPKPSRSFQIGSGGNMTGLSGLQSMNTTSLDPLVSTIGMPIYPPQHTLRHRRPNQLPLAKDLAHDLDQLDDLLQYIGYTSPECLNSTTGGSQLNTASPTPLGQHLEAQTISIILGQRAVELDYVARNCNNFTISQQQSAMANNVSISSLHSNESFIYGSGGGGGSSSSCNDNGNNSLLLKHDLPFHYCRLLFSQLGIAGWERRKRTNLLIRTEKLFRELKNLDKKFCRETHKMAVIYVANGQEDKNSILRNACGSSTYEMFVSALGWEVELETHNGFTGGLLQGCGSTSPYYATPFLEVIYHVATRMPCDTPDAILKKTKHLGNDEVHIVWSEHHRDYRRDILPTEFCDVLITVYPLKSGLFRVTVNRKPDVPWFGPLYDEAVVGGSCLASLVRATAINASRAKRISLPLHQQFYEERKRSLDTVATIHKDSNTFEEFAARIYTPIPFQNSNLHSMAAGTTTTTTTTTAHALIDHQRGSTKLNRIQILPADPLTIISSSSSIIRGDAVQQQQQHHTLSMALDHASPRPLRKLHPFIKNIPKQKQQQLQQIGGSFIIHNSNTSGFNTPPDSPTLPGRKLKL